MKIRPYETRDEAAVIELWRECGLLRWSDPKKDIARKMKVNPEWFLVGEIDGRVMATCMLGYEGHRGWINLLGVASPYRGGGHAKELMAEAERLMRAIGCAKINLQVRSTNTEVIAFYEGLGYSTDPLIGMGKRLEAD
ncbi:MAG: ypeA [Verrucomicrobia bacterium]|nr:ypeA [Verrucomicrobiota bacterium]